MGTMQLSRVFLFAALTVLSGHLLGGCAGKDVYDGDPGKLYQEAEEDIKNDKLLIATDKLKTIKNKFPYSNFATEAQLRLGDVYFLQESYAEAAATYEVFRELHPKHPKVPYAMFRAGKAYFADAPSTVARDVSSVQKSVDAYNEYLKKFPSAPEADEVRKELASARNMLADKELYIAQFYFKRDMLDSARSRFLKVIDLYPETDAAKAAKEKLPLTETPSGKSDKGE